MARPTRRLTWFLLILLSLLGFALRAYRLGALGIWGDEAWSISFALKPLAVMLAPGSDTLPPLYQLLLWPWIRLAGDSEYAARFLSLIPGLLLIPATYLAGKRLAGRSTGLVAAALMTVSPFAVAYSQEARMYTWLTLWCALSVYFAARLWEVTTSQPFRSHNPLSMHGEGVERSEGGEAPPASALVSLAAAYLLVTLAAMYTHFYALLIIAAQDVYVLWLYRRRPAWLTRWIAGQLILGLGFLVWLTPQLAYFTGRAQSRGDALGLTTLWQIVSQTATAFSVGFPAPAGLSAGLVLMLSVLAAGLIVLLRPAASRRPGPFTALYLFLPILLAWLTGPFLVFFHPRYLMEALPAFLIAVAAGLVWLGQGRRKAVSTLTLAALIVLSGLSLAQLYTSPIYAKSGYREMMADIAARERPGDVVFLLNPEQDALFDYYGDKRLPSLTFPPPPGTSDGLATVARNDHRIWLVMFGDARAWDPGGDLQSWLNDHAFEASRDSLIDTQVELYVIGQVEPSPIPPVDFGGLIRLDGLGLSAQSVAPGETLQIALAWQSEAPMSRDYTIFTHLLDSQGRLVAQFDGPPLGGAHPTSSWRPGEKNVDRFGIPLDPSIPPGEYHLEVGWYDLSTLKRIPVLDSHGQPLADHAILSAITVR